MRLTQDRDNTQRIERDRLIQEFNNRQIPTKQDVQIRLLIIKIKRLNTELEHLERCKSQQASTLRQRLLEAKLRACGKKIDELLIQAVQ